jgi:hypothetical protein
MSVCFTNDRLGVCKGREDAERAPYEEGDPDEGERPARLDRPVDHRADRFGVERRRPHDRFDDELARGSLAEEIGEGHDPEDHQLEEGENAEVGHAPREGERVMVQEPDDRPAGDPGEPAPQRPGVQAGDEALQSVRHRSPLERTSRAA